MFLSYQLMTKTFPPKYVNKNYYDDQIDLLLYENNYCLMTNLH